MPDLTYGELIPFQGTNGGDTLINVANAAADLVCDLYERYPTGILPSIGSTPVTNLTDGLLNRLCGPRGQTPPPATVPFTGGQCACDLYVANFTTTFANGTTENGSTRALPGPIIGVVQSNRREANPTVVDVGFKYGSPACGGINVDGYLGNAVDPVSVVINSITRVSPGPDNCGNPNPQYNPSLPPANEFNTTNNVTIGGTVINTPITLIPTIFAPVNIFRPEFNVDVGGINVKFDLGGVSFSPSINPTTNINLPGGDTRPLPPTPLPGNQKDCPSVDLSPLFPRFDNLDTQLDIIQECACGPDQTINTQLFGPANSRTITLPSNTIGVRVIITTEGQRLRSQYGGGNAPDVLFIGWCSFGNGSPAGLRVPISHAVNFFFAPERATAFSYTVVMDSEARLEVVYLEDNP